MIRGSHVMKNQTQQQSFQSRLGKVPSVEKYRRMACNTFIMAGSCPYQARCVFLHDPRVESAEIVPHKPQKQIKGAARVPKDAWYWPDMDKKNVLETSEHMNNMILPACFQRYVVPSDFASSNAHDRGLYSLWTHFAEYVESPHVCDHSCNEPNNRHLPVSDRLPVFIKLGEGYESTVHGWSQPMVLQKADENETKVEQKWSDAATDVSCTTSEGEDDSEDESSSCDDSRATYSNYTGPILGPDWFSELAVPFINSRSRSDGFDARIEGTEIKDIQHAQECVYIDKLIRDLTKKFRSCEHYS
jgi:hypothetical protein